MKSKLLLSNNEEVKSTNHVFTINMIPVTALVTTNAVQINLRKSLVTTKAVLIYAITTSPGFIRVLFIKFYFKGRKLSTYPMISFFAFANC